MRAVVALSGGADSVALLLSLHERASELGLVLHAAHLHHSLRGAEADGDRDFCRDLAARLNLPFHTAQIDTAAEAAKAGEGIEEAARRLRYAWFRTFASEGPAHAVVATAHTLDDQAETVLAKFLRGAWTGGLAGIYPKLEGTDRILRPMLGTTRAEVEAFLTARGQSWREDSTNRQTTFTRNRIRHKLLPELESWNPRLREHLAHMATLARDEEAFWQAEVARIAPGIVLPGKPVRGGGRAASEGLAIDVTRFATLPTALQRRLLRHAAAQLGAAPGFAATEDLRTLALTGRASQKAELEGGLRAERTHRELRLNAGAAAAPTAAALTIPVPGELRAEAFGLHLRLESLQDSAEPLPPATLRPWKPGDRVRLRHSSVPRKVKEVLDRLHIAGEARAHWPVLEWQGRILWMRGAELEPDPVVRVRADELASSN